MDCRDMSKCHVADVSGNADYISVFLQQSILQVVMTVVLGVWFLMDDILSHIKIKYVR